METTGTVPDAPLALRAAARLKALALLCLLGVIYALRPLVRVRFGTLVAGRLGHLAANTECYLCERAAGLHRRTFDIWTPEKPANAYLLKMYERAIFTWHSRIPAMLGKAAEFLDWWHEHQFSDANMGRDIYNLFERVPAHLSFTRREEARGEAELCAMGIPKGAKWVCLIVRDAAYLRDKGNFAYHDFRDSDINAYRLAAFKLAQRGYYVVRMGAAVEKPFRVAHHRVIDYANEGRSEFMDIYLGAKCEFCLSNATGFDAIPMVFRRPICFVNVAPVEYLQTYLKDSIAVWKHHFRAGQRMTFAEIIESGAGRVLTSQAFKAGGIELEDNTPDEIADAAQEMADRVEGMRSTVERSTVEQSSFWSAFPRSISTTTGMPLHGEIRMRVGREFFNNLQREPLRREATV